MSKNFLTYNQQMKYLREKKEIQCEGSNDKTILRKAGYFNLVNGYKGPFILSKENDSHTYIKGTSIKELYELKKFDDELRMHLLKYVTKVEEEVRTITGHRFDEVNKHGKVRWYEVTAYSVKSDAEKVVKVISDSFQEVQRSQQNYIQHYLEKHKYVPTWIMVKTIKFSTFIDFLKCSKIEVKDSICNLYGFKKADGKNDYTLLIGSLHWIRKVRNSCAHNERIYGITREGKRIKIEYFNKLGKSYCRSRNQKLIDLIIYMRYYLTDRDYKKFVSEIKVLLSDLAKEINNQSFNKVRADMGIKKLEDLDIMMNTKKKINYNILN